MRISLVGLPGSGKTTIAQLLSGMFNIPHISSGQLARASGFAGSTAEKGGRLDPDEDKIRKLVKQAIGDNEHYILDGFPRMISQMKHIDIPIDTIVHLRLSDREIGVNRLLSRARPDDKLDIIQNRIATYYEHTHPIVMHARNELGNLMMVNASNTIAETLSQVVVQLASSGEGKTNNYLANLLKDDLEGLKRKKTKTNNKRGTRG